MADTIIDKTETNKTDKRHWYNKKTNKGIALILVGIALSFNPTAKTCGEIIVKLGGALIAYGLGNRIEKSKNGETK